MARFLLRMKNGIFKNNTGLTRQSIWNRRSGRIKWAERKLVWSRLWFSSWTKGFLNTHTLWKQSITGTLRELGEVCGCSEGVMKRPGALQKAPPTSAWMNFKPIRRKRAGHPWPCTRGLPFRFGLRSNVFTCAGLWLPQHGYIHQKETW